MKNIKHIFKNKDKKSLILFSIIFLIGLLLVTPLGNKAYFYLTTIGSSKVQTDSEILSYKDKDSIGQYLSSNGDIGKYAPKPKESFRDSECNLSPLKEVTELAPNTWEVPSISATSHFTESGMEEGYIVLPNAPEGTYYNYSKPIGSDSGSTLIAGHVDYQNEGKLSPYGRLHNITPCSRVYVSNKDGQISEYVATDLYTVPQDMIDKEEGVWSLTGEPSLYLITCSGPSVSDVGGSFRFNYENNLIVRFSKATS